MGADAKNGSIWMMLRAIGLYAGTDVDHIIVMIYKKIYGKKGRCRTSIYRAKCKSN